MLCLAASVTKQRPPVQLPAHTRPHAPQLALLDVRSPQLPAEPELAPAAPAPLPAAPASGAESLSEVRAPQPSAALNASNALIRRGTTHRA